MGGRARRGQGSAVGAWGRSLLAWVWLGAALGAVLGPDRALAEDSWLHRGSLGVTIAGGGEFITSIVTGHASENRLRAPMELGGTLSVTDHTEARLAARVSAPGPTPDWSLYLGIRNSRGERFKTFFDLDLAAHVYPAWSLGLRLGLGVQYELLPVMGAFAVAGVQGGAGAGLRLGFELLLGLQFRTYLFE